LRLFKGEGYPQYEWSTLGVPSALDEPYIIVEGKPVNPETGELVDTAIRKDERVRNAVAALDLLRRERNLVPMGAECFVWSRDYGYAGTVDLAADTGEGRVDLYDWKTSGALYPEVWLQLAAYATAFTASYGIEVRRIYPVRLDRGQPTLTGPRRVHYEADEYMEWPEIADAFEAYMGAQDLGKWIREHGGRY